MPLEFEWDAAKAELNLASHGVTFEEASTTFADFLSLTIPDSEHSADEDRFVTIGMSGLSRLLVVAHTDRDGRIRIISAREASPSERRQYENEPA